MKNALQFCFWLLLATVGLPVESIFAQFIPNLPVSYYVTRIKDINPNGSDVNPLKRVVEFDGKAYFSGTDGVNGFELWVTDGTAAGTVMVKNINPSGNSYPDFFTVMNGKLYFKATNGVNGYELWRTDGTANGTQLVKDINATGDSYPTGLIANGTILFFFAQNEAGDYGLWKTDGTTDGTRYLKQVKPIPNAFDPTTSVVLNGKVYFGGNAEPYGTEVWVTDGTVNGTKIVKDIHPNGGIFGTFMEPMVVCNGLIFFAANDGTHGEELWKSDGTSAGTQLVKDIKLGDEKSGVTELTVNGNTVYFSAYSTNYDRELWKSNGTTAGTVLVKKINPDGSSLPSGLTVFKNQIYFHANDGEETALWKSNGTSLGTLKVKKVVPGYMTVLDDLLFFRNGNEGPWRSDGTSAGTYSMEPGLDIIGYSHYYVTVGNKVIFYGQPINGLGVSDYSLYKIAPCYACPAASSRVGVSEEPTTELSVTILKNPTQDAVTVDVRGVVGTPLSLHLTNLQGQVISSKYIEQAQELEQHTFNVQAQPAGILLLRAVSGDRSQTVRISKPN